MVMVQKTVEVEVDLDEIDTDDLIGELKSRGLDPEEAVGASADSLQNQRQEMLKAFWRNDENAAIELLKTYLCDCLGRAAV